MRSLTEIELIREIKKCSTVDEKHFILESGDKREFFRFDNGRLVEYEMTKSGGRPIKYKPEEVEGESEFKFSEL